MVVGDFFLSKLCSFCKRFRGRVIIFGDGKGMKSKGAMANIREARISHARITDFSSGKSRYTIFARKLVGQLSTLPIIIAVRSKIHESEEISPPTFRQASKIRYTPFPFSILFFFFDGVSTVVRSSPRRNYSGLNWIRFYFDIFYFDQYFDNPHDLDTKLFHFKSLEYSIPKIPTKLKFSIDFSKIRFFSLLR